MLSWTLSEIDIILLVKACKNDDSKVAITKYRKETKIILIIIGREKPCRRGVHQKTNI